MVTKALDPGPKGPSFPFRVDVVGGADKGASLAIAGPVFAGTSTLCALRLTDTAVSRRHCLLESRGRRVRVRDEASKNGTWIGSVRVSDVEVPALTEIKVGESVLRLDVDRKRAMGPSSPATDAGPGALGRFIARAPAVVDAIEVLHKAAPSTATILLEGESGVGKELLAEAIHDHSQRSAQPFVVVDCAANAGELADAFERAAGGTLFLDDVGELSSELQAELLGALERKKPKLDVRVVAATAKNLERAVENLRFKLELFHLLAVVTVRVPPLRERLDDIEPLARAFAQRLGMADDAAAVLLTPDLLARLREHSWPGNVQELQNTVERLVLIGDRALTQQRPPEETVDLLAIARSGMPYRQARELAVEGFTEQYVDDMLRRHSGNVTRAAEAAGIARRHFHRLKRG